MGEEQYGGCKFPYPMAWGGEALIAPCGLHGIDVVYVPFQSRTYACDSRTFMYVHVCGGQRSMSDIITLQSSTVSSPP